MGKLTEKWKLKKKKKEILELKYSIQNEEFVWYAQ